MEKMMDRCGLFGMFDNNGFHTSHLIYYGLFSMQHRGMEAAGICVNDNQGNFSYVKDEGLVTEVFDEMKLEKLQGHAGIGHILRYDGSDANDQLCVKLQKRKKVRPRAGCAKALYHAKG